MVHGVALNRCRENTAHVRQSRPDSGLGFQVKVLKPLSSCCLFARKRDPKPETLSAAEVPRLEATSLHPTSYTLHPTPYTPYPTPYALALTPNTPHPTPYTLHLREGAEVGARDVVHGVPEHPPSRHLSK